MAGNQCHVHRAGLQRVHCRAHKERDRWEEGLSVNTCGCRQLATPCLLWPARQTAWLGWAGQRRAA